MSLMILVLINIIDYSTCVQCCPCNTGNTVTTVPSFVGSNYHCESGIASGDWSSVLYANVTLWDDNNVED